MAVWVAISVALACLCIGFAVSTWANGASSSDLEAENFHLLIENERLKRGMH